jgi:hypothetical protein
MLLERGQTRLREREQLMEQQPTQLQERLKLTNQANH